MSRVQLETRRHYRAAATWALLGGAAMAVAGALFLAGPNRASARLSAASAHALAFGMVGDVWLAALLRYLSSQPSKASVRPRLLGFIFVIWNGAVVASTVTLLLGRTVRARGLQPLPFSGTVAALAVAALVAPVALRRLSGIPPVSYHHLAAVAALTIGLGLGDIAYITNDARLESAAEMLVIGGFLPFAGAALFFGVFDYESYEDRRWPLLSVIAIGVAMVLRFSFFYEILNSNGLNLITGLCGFALLIAMATVLRMRWQGGMSTWFERIAFASVVGLAVCAFLGLEQPIGSPVGPLSLPGGLLFVVAPSALACLVGWAGAYAIKLDQSDLTLPQARLVMWPLLVGALIYPVGAKLSDSVRNHAGTARTFIGLGGLGVGVALVVLALHLLRRPRLRAVR